MLICYTDLRHEREVPHIDDHYDKIGKLGKGNFGTVYKAIKKTTKRTVALKVIDKAKMEQSDRMEMLEALLQQEIEIIKACSHPQLLEIS